MKLVGQGCLTYKWQVKIASIITVRWSTFPRWRLFILAQREVELWLVVLLKNKILTKSHGPIKSSFILFNYCKIVKNKSIYSEVWAMPGLVAK